MQSATSRTDNGISAYFAQIARFPILSRDEEHALAVRARAGDAEARQRLVRHSLGFVVAVVRRFGLGSVRLDDVVQEGNLGLLRALEKFDPDAGTRFATYATWWIRAYVSKYVKEARSIVRPRGGSVATADFSLDATLDDEDETTHLDRVEEPRSGPEASLLERESAQRVRDALERHRRRIGPVGCDIIERRLQCEECPSLERVGQRWGISRERVRQIELRTKSLLAGFLDDRAA
jgi:RNA polymerase primary sigma factor